MSAQRKEAPRNLEKLPFPANIVVDTNVLIDGLYGRSSASQTILELLEEGNCRLVYTKRIRKEFNLIATSLPIGNRWTAEVMPKGYRYRINQLFREGIDVTKEKRRKPTYRLPTGDQTDAKFVIAARKSDCVCIISRDRHLLALPNYGGFRDLAVLTPDQFLKKSGFT